MTLVSIDPGATTGYSRWSYECEVVSGTAGYDDQGVTGVWNLVEAGEFPNHMMLDKLIVEDMPTYVLYERFHLVSVAVDKTPIEVIGVVKYLAGRQGYQEGYDLIPRSPGERMFATRRYGEPTHKSIHARASINHAVSWLHIIKEYRSFNYGLRK